VELLHPDVVLIGGHLRVLSPEAMRSSVDGIGYLVDAMKPFAEEVVVIGDPPVQDREPVDCLLAHDATLATCTGTLSNGQLSMYEDAASVTQSGGGAFLDTIGWFCFEDRCPMVIGHTIAYRDTDHITKTYALELRELFRDAFTRALSR
jgi:hypothetical protein